jgi:hypothetical protein
MNWRTAIYDLLLGYEADSVEPLQEFYAVWCRGIDVAETARRLQADPASMVPVNATEPAAPLGNIGPDWRLVLIGDSGPWTAVFGDYECTTKETMAALSAEGGAAISVGWHISGGERVKYFVDGEQVTSFNFLAPGMREGADPGALDDLMEGLRFDAGEVESFGESVTSVFVLIGRVTGRQLDRAWLDATHMRAVIPPSS